jgi:hypothetical protein
MNRLSDNSARADNQQATRKINDDYFSGFVDGEGCFYIGFSKRVDLPIPWQVITEFHVSQNLRSRNVLEALSQRLECGYLKPNNRNNTKDKSWVLIVKNRQDLLKKVIPFFESHPLFSTKKEDFLLFKHVLQAIEQGEHLTKKGFIKIVDQVFALEKDTNKRYFKNDLLSF